MAATYGRLTGKAGVCLATLGPGATNFTTTPSLWFSGWISFSYDYGAKANQE